MVYQGFSLLTANRHMLASNELARIARRHGREVCQIIFRFALDVGMLPLTGTTGAGHMRSDLEAFDFHLEPEEVEWIKVWQRLKTMGRSNVSQSPTVCKSPMDARERFAGPTYSNHFFILKCLSANSKNALQSPGGQVWPPV